MLLLTQGGAAAMLLRFDPFRDIDRLTNELLGAPRVPQPMPMECYRVGDTFYLHFDLPGIDPESLDVTAENNTLTVRAERRGNAPEGAVYVVSERPAGAYARQLVLGEGLDLDAIRADYHDGVLTLTVPVAEEAKPRRIEIGRSDDSYTTIGGHKTISGESTESRQDVGSST
jgi:HSP20 family protein